jgi:hypothetical protein
MHTLLTAQRQLAASVLARSLPPHRVDESVPEGPQAPGGGVAGHSKQVLQAIGHTSQQTQPCGAATAAATAATAAPIAASTAATAAAASLCHAPQQCLLCCCRLLVSQYSSGCDHGVE